MRLFWLGIPAGLALASAGLLLYTQAMKPHNNMADVITDQPRHPVTDDMRVATGAKARKVAPAFSLTDVDKKPVTIAAPGADRPQFVYFVMDGCPCSYEAEPLFHDLAERFKGQVDFVAVTDADPEAARKWWLQMMVPYPVVSDEKLDVMKAYGALNSVYSALVSTNGEIIKMWPGYSIDILLDMNELMAKEAGVKAEKFDTKYAPIEESSGCAFLLD